MGTEHREENEHEQNVHVHTSTKEDTRREIDGEDELDTQDKTQRKTGRLSGEW